MRKCYQIRNGDLALTGKVWQWLGMEEVTAIRLQGDHVMKLKDEILLDIPISKLDGKTLVVNLVADPSFPKGKRVRKPILQTAANWFPPPYNAPECDPNYTI